MSFSSRYRVLDPFVVPRKGFTAYTAIISYLHCLLTENTATHVARIASLQMSFCTIIIIKERAKGEKEIGGSGRKFYLKSIANTGKKIGVSRYYTNLAKKKKINK